MDNLKACGLLAMSLWFVGSTAQAQFGPDHVVLRPSTLTPSTLIQADAPVVVCFHSDPVAAVVSSLVQVTGNVVTLTVHAQPPLVCFAAGDYPVPKAVTFSLLRLPVGEYMLRYLRYDYSALGDDESVSFAVSDAPAIPILSGGGYILLILMFFGVAAYVMQRVS